MSKFKKSVLVGAIAFSIAGAAAAGTSITATSTKFAHELTGGPVTSYTNSPQADAAEITFNIAAPQILIGRGQETGQVTVSATLIGAQIAAAPVPEIWDNTGPTPVLTNPTTATLALQGSLQGSVTSGTDSFQFVILPPLAADGGFTTAEPLFELSSLKLKKADALKVLGGEVKLQVKVQDTTTGATLAETVETAILTSVQATETEHDGFETTIDVFADSYKTLFDYQDRNAVLGTVLVDVRDLTGNGDYASALGTAALDNVNNGQFVYSFGQDEVEFTLNVPKAAAFQRLYVHNTSGNCYNAAPGTAVLLERVGTTNDFKGTIKVGNTWGDDYTICAVADGVTKIDAQTIGLTTQIKLDTPIGVNPPAKTTAAFAKLVYNGSVVEVDHFNPAANATQVSYLRIINPSSAGGLVTIEGVCDDGTEQAGVSVELAAGNAILLTAQDLKNGAKGLSGGFTQCAAGKSRLTVTGEFADMSVQNFLRNITADGGQINTNVNNQN